jgi:acyl CoA:acetate/3-ketoacid CoA transferase
MVKTVDIDYGLLERAVFRLKEQGILLPEILNKVTRWYMGWDKRSESDE